MFSLYPFRGYCASVFEAYTAVANGAVDRGHLHAPQHTEAPRKRKWSQKLSEFVKKSEHSDNLSRCGL